MAGARGGKLTDQGLYVVRPLPQRSADVAFLVDGLCRVRLGRLAVGGVFMYGCALERITDWCVF